MIEIKNIGTEVSVTTNEIIIAVVYDDCEVQIFTSNYTSGEEFYVNDIVDGSDVRIWATIDEIEEVVSTLNFEVTPGEDG